MGQTAGFAAGSWIVRQPPSDSTNDALAKINGYKAMGSSIPYVQRQSAGP